MLKNRLMKLEEIEEVERNLSVSLRAPLNALCVGGEHYGVYTLEGKFIADVGTVGFFSKEELTEKILAILK